MITELEEFKVLGDHRGQLVALETNKQIPFDVSNEIPNNASLMFLCDNPDLPESKNKNVIVTPVFNTDIISKFAYFKINS